MNLAEIRKKANRDRGAVVDATPETERPVQSTPDLAFFDETAVPAEPAPADEPAEPLVFEEPLVVEEPVVVEEPPRESAAPLQPPPDVPVIVTPALPASNAVSFVPPAALGGMEADLPPMDEIVGAETLSEPPRNGSFNPIALLLAGRVAAGYDEETPLASPDGTETEQVDYHEFLCFRVASEQYAINIMEIKEIIKPREITEVPRVPAFISGVLSLRGIIIPVFAMGTRLQLAPAGEPGKERIIVVSKGEELFGLAVDEVLQVVRVPNSAIEQPPLVLDGIDRDFVQGIGRHDSRMLILLNLANILDISLC